ncbi:hypothetical protein ACMA1I_01480 [Pontibacter sp. 13R65]
MHSFVFSFDERFISAHLPEANKLFSVYDHSAFRVSDVSVAPAKRM